jgi:hypothetical protein
MTKFYCLRFETPPTWRANPRIYILQEQGGPVIPQALGSLFFASYDWQGYGGGTRTRLHTGFSGDEELGDITVPTGVPRTDIKESVHQSVIRFYAIFPIKILCEPLNSFQCRGNTSYIHTTSSTTPQSYKQPSPIIVRKQTYKNKI